MQRKSTLLMFLFPFALWSVGQGVIFAQTVPNQTGFPVTFVDGGERVIFSSVAVADINGDGLKDVVVGGQDGKVHAYLHSGEHYWTFDTQSMAVSSTPAVADIDHDGYVEIVITTADPNTRDIYDGGLWVLDDLGNQKCRYHTGDFDRNGREDGIFSSVALADLDGHDNGKLEMVFNGWDGTLTALNDDCSVYWSLFLREATWSSVAIGDVDMDGSPEVVAGVGTHFDGPPINTENGGMIHVFRSDGQSELPGFPIQVDEVLQSPVVGDIDGDGFPDIIAGIGRCWDLEKCAPGGNTHAVTEVVYAWDRFGESLTGWPVSIPGQFASISPALADLDGDDLPEVVLNTIEKDGSDSGEGWVHVLNGDGSAAPGWPIQAMVPADPVTAVSPSTTASLVVADITGDGHLEVLIGLNFEIVIWDYLATQLTHTDCCPVPDGWQVKTEYIVGSTPAVADLDDDGDLEVVVGGSSAGGVIGMLYAWDFGDQKSSSGLIWPQFRRDHVSRGALLDVVFLSGFESGAFAYWAHVVP